MKRILVVTLALIPLLVLAACENSAYKEERVATGQNQVRLRSGYPLPALSRSEELENLGRRLERINAQNMSGCIYLVSYGRVMAHYAVDGKVTSLNAYLTPLEEYVNGVPRELPDLDGAYGENADGVFFFTTDNAYVEWKGEYMWSDLCVPLSEQPVMMTVVSNEPTPTPAPASVP